MIFTKSREKTHNLSKHSDENYDTDSKEKISYNANKSVSDDSEKKPVDNINKDTSNKILQVDEGNQDIFRFTQNPNFIQYSIQRKFDTGDTIQEAADEKNEKEESMYQIENSNNCLVSANPFSVPSSQLPAKTSECKQLTLKYKDNKELKTIDYNKFEKGIRQSEDHSRVESMDKRIKDLERRLKTFRIPNKLTVKSKISELFKRTRKSQDDYESDHKDEKNRMKEKIHKIENHEVQNKHKTKANTNPNDSKGNVSRNHPHEKKKNKDNIYSIRMQFENKHKRAKSEVALNSLQKVRLLNIKQSNGSKIFKDHQKKSTSQIKLPLEYKTNDMKTERNHNNKHSRIISKQLDALNFSEQKIANTTRNRDSEQNLHYAPKIQNKLGGNHIWNDKNAKMDQSNKSVQSNKETKIKRKFYKPKEDNINDPELENYPIIGGKRILPSLKSKHHFTFSHLSSDSNTHKTQGLPSIQNQASDKDFGNSMPKKQNKGI